MARQAICAELWKAGVKAEYVLAAAPNMPKQLAHALEAGIPLMARIPPRDHLAKCDGR